MFEELLPNSKFKEHQLSVFFPVGNLVNMMQYTETQSDTFSTKY